MKRLLFALIILSGTRAFGQGPSDVAGTSADAIAALDKKWAAAYQACDAAAMSGLVADDLVFIHSSGKIEDRAAHLASVERCLLEAVTTEATRIRLYGQDTAVVVGTLSGKVRGRDSTFSQLYTRVYIRQIAGGWRLVAHQAVDAPK